MNIRVLILFNLLPFLSIGQNTVGLLSYNQELSSPGYNLIFPHAQPNVYLLNACGEIVHEWKDSEGLAPGNSVYLLENGDLIKCKRKLSSGSHEPIWAGGGGETVEILSWDNEVKASFTLNDSTYRLHHDVAPMPNGNILMIAWESRTKAEVLALGRDPETLNDDHLWALAILEWDPDTDEIVWEWHTYDHLIQDFNETLPGYGVIEEHPEKININYVRNPVADWLHTNSIDYNPVLDQIVVSVPNFDELWIIDHSTTISEASSDAGGLAEKGGDLLYRWGNPRAYNAGNEDDQQLFYQHDVHWIEPNAEAGDPYYGQLMIFNNNLPGGYSAVNSIITPLNGFNYTLGSNNTFLPQDFDKTILHPESSFLAFSNGLSNAQLLDNGNILVFSGRWGYAYELTEQDEIVWEYRVPLKVGKPVNQGDTSLLINDNLTFRMNRYSVDYPAFIGKDLEPKGYIENMPDETYCDRLLNVEDENLNYNSEIRIYPNPVEHMVFIECESNLIGDQYEVYDAGGRKILSGILLSDINRIDMSQLEKGMYLLKVGMNRYTKIIKQ